MKLRLLILFILLFAIDYYVFQGVRTLTRNLLPTTSKLIQTLYWSMTALFFVAIVVGILTMNPAEGPTPVFKKIFAVIALTYFTKLFFILFLFVEDISRLLLALFFYIKSWFITPSSPISFMPERRKFISQAALLLVSVPFAALIYGITKGKYQFTVHRDTIFFDDLPQEFDGMTITQISDVHSGSFDSETDVLRGIKLINEQNSDLFVFTGDLVNNTAQEMERWKPFFSQIKKHPLGNFSILGNHDYGDYIRWETPEAKKQNLNDLKTVHSQIGFRLLLNENVPLTKSGAQINLMGIENWGLPPFPQYGDLQKATTNLKKDDFKILLSHDPSHWTAQVIDFTKKVQLTLSGHTHGMQFGIEVPGFIKWSPVKYKYKNWAGLYQKANQYLYVNRGFGFLGFPGRVGIWPEVTVLTLRKKV